MNDAAQSSSRMVSKIKSSFLSQSQLKNNQSSAPAGRADDTAFTQDISSNSISDTAKLAVLSGVIDEVEKPEETVQENQNGSLNPSHPVKSGGKEAVESGVGPDQSAIEAGAIQYVEQEKNPEIPVEVEGYLQKVEDMAEEKPQEVFIADGSEENADTTYPSRPVVVLPITQEIEESGKKKNPTFSIRWLVEWSHKIIKMLAGKVIYREDPV